ncbi:MAG: T9SS type A sorting domain-containing protein [Bacteroidota bacterium]
MIQPCFSGKATFLTIIFWSLFALGSQAQRIAEWNFSIPVSRGNDAFALPWVGGLNAVQYNNLRLNDDDQEDLLLFDRSSSTLHPFLRQNGQWVYAPEYIPFFPEGLQSWIALRDYDQDGDQDIFTASGGRGISVYRNERENSGSLRWTKVADPLRTVAFASGATVTLQVNSADYPAIADVDGDGDLDIVNYSGIGSGNLILHQNQSIEQFNRPDSLVYRTISIRWGEVEECNCGLFAFGDQTCDDLSSGSRQLLEAKLEHVGGKALLIVDADGDGDLDALSGDEGCFGTALLKNQPTDIPVAFQQLETNFPENTQPASSIFFPGAFLADANGDGVNDLLFSPNVSTNVGNNIDFRNSSWWYRNDGTEQVPNWQWQSSGFLQDEMIDVGEDAVPALADYDADGDLDLFIGNRGELQSDGFYAGLYLYENIGNTSLPSFQFITSNFLGLTDWKLQELKPYFTDINQDGKIDLIISGRESVSRETRLYALLNQADAGLPADFQPKQRQLLNLPFRSEDNLTFYDIDVNQQMDVLVGKQSGNLVYYRNQSSNFPPQWMQEDDAFAGIERNARGMFLASAVADTDGDGADELVSIDARGRLLLRSLDANSTDEVDTIVVQNDLLSEAVPIQFGRQNWLATGQITAGRLTVAVGSQRGGISLLHLRQNGAGEEGESASLGVFPNPATDSDVTTVQASGAVRQVQIISAAGQVVFNQSLTQPLSRLSLETRVLPTGLYIVRVFLETGSVVSAKLLVAN